MSTKKTIQLELPNKSAEPDTRDRSEYMRARALTVKQQRQDLLQRCNHIPFIKKFKSTVSNGFSAVGITEAELIELETLFKKAKVTVSKPKRDE